MRASRTLPTSFAFSVFKVSPSEATASFRRGATRIDLRSPSAGHDLVETGTRVTTSHECMPCTASAKVHGAWHGAWCLVGVDSRLVFLRVRAVRPRNRAGAAPPMCGERCAVTAVSARARLRAAAGRRPEPPIDPTPHTRHTLPHKRPNRCGLKRERLFSQDSSTGDAVSPTTCRPHWTDWRRHESATSERLAPRQG